MAMQFQLHFWQEPSQPWHLNWYCSVPHGQPGVQPEAEICLCTGKQHASCYCVRKGLIRKAHLAHNLKKWAAKHPDGTIARGVPETLIMEVDDVDYIDEALADVYEVCWRALPGCSNISLHACAAAVRKP